MKCWYPDEWRKSSYAIDYKAMYEMGYKGIIFDIDNTLVFHGKPATDEAIELFKTLREIGFKTCLISNNKQERVEPFAKLVDSPYIYKADKPAKKSYEAAMRIMKTKRNETFFVGDQLFTDVWGAKRVGIHSILVCPLNPKEEIQIVLKRYLEKIVLFFYKKQGGKLV